MSQAYELETFYKAIGNLYPQHGEDFFLIALTHETANAMIGENYEQLEFLGDAVLSTVISEYLFTHFPQKNEGELSKLRAYIVCRKQLNSVAKEIGIKSFIRHKFDDKMFRQVKDIGGDVVEAVIGAFFLDGGLDAAKKFIYKWIIPENKIENFLHNYKNPKSVLLEWAQRKNKRLEFRWLNPNIQNPNEFKIHIYLDNRPYGLGSGNSKKAAERNAAAITLDMLNPHT